MVTIHEDVSVESLRNFDAKIYEELRHKKVEWLWCVEAFTGDLVPLQDQEREPHETRHPFALKPNDAFGRNSLGYVIPNAWLPVPFFTTNEEASGEVEEYMLNKEEAMLYLQHKGLGYLVTLVIYRETGTDTYEGEAWTRPLAKCACFADMRGITW